jgi:hypothetical protein
MRAIPRPLSAMMLALCAGPASAITLVPPWDGEPLTTYANYTFTTNSRTAPPEAYTNPHGVPALLVEDEQFFGTGWQDPNGEFQLTRVPGEGAWDLGQHGKMSITVPIVATGDLTPKELVVFMNLIWYSGPVSTPTFTVENHVPISQSSQSEIVQFDGAGQWRRTVWEATFTGYLPDSITLVLQAPWNGSVIDSVALYTLIPEPSAALLAVVSCFGICLRRRRG